ncbi:hypothetical protein [Carboxylicivirga taeanensis]|uniref:hypothetical protein n=1 Tax=Carboxylicivirga taeanensis TaxID=1416875 RepID=UPI003F6E244D
MKVSPRKKPNLQKLSHSLGYAIFVHLNESKEKHKTHMHIMTVSPLVRLNCLLFLLLMLPTAGKAQAGLESGFYTFLRIDSIDEDISWSGIAQLHLDCYLYVDSTNKQLSYFKWGNQLRHRLQMIDEHTYGVMDGYLWGCQLHKEDEQTLLLDNLILGELNTSIPYRSEWKKVEETDAEFLELQKWQSTCLEKDAVYLQTLKKKIETHGFKDYPGIYKDIHIELRSENSEQEERWSGAQIKLPLEEISFREGLCSFFIPNIDKVYMRRVRHVFPLSKKSSGAVNARQVLIQGNSSAKIEVGIELFEIKAPENAIDWDYWKNNSILSPLQILHDEPNGTLFLCNDGTELLANYHYYDHKHNCHVLACGGTDSDDIDGINTLYSILRTLNRTEHQGEIMTIHSAVQLSPDAFKSKYGAELLTQLSDSALQAESRKKFGDIEKLLQRPWFGNCESGMFLLGNFANKNTNYLNYSIHKNSLEEALHDFSSHSIVQKSEVLYKDETRMVAILDDTRFVSRFAVPKNGLIYVFDKVIGTYRHSVIELEAAAFFQDMKQARLERFIPQLPASFIRKYVYAFDNAESLPATDDDLQFKVWNADAEPVILKLPKKLLKTKCKSQLF